MTQPLVSILVPTYNGERFLRPALRSALEQSYRTIEVVVGDDASTDSTPQILADVAAADDRVRVIRHQTNVGAHENPLRLLQEARGEYIKFLLHDDVLAVDCVRDLVRGIESSPGLSLAFSRRVLIDENGRTRPDGDLKPLRERAGVIDGRELGDAALESCANIIGELTTILFRRADVDPAGLWRVDGQQLHVLNDLKLSLQLLTRGSAFYSPRALSRFRIHGAQNTFKPELIARGIGDWPVLIDWGVRQGFLTDEARQRRAFAAVLQGAAGRVGQLVGGPEHGPALEAVFLAAARLVELGVGTPLDRTASLARRAHGRALLERFGQPLDVWTREYPVALAAPAVDRQEIAATVQAFRDVLGGGVAKRLLLCVPQPKVDQAVPLVESALAQGSDIDVELVPTDTPAALLAQPWLAVARREDTWHRDRATAVWWVEPPAVPEAAAGA